MNKSITNIELFIKTTYKKLKNELTDKLIRKNIFELTVRLITHE